MTAPVVWPDPACCAEPTPEPRHLDLEAAWGDYEAVHGEWAPRSREQVLDATRRAVLAIDAAWRSGTLGVLPELAAELGIDAPHDATARHYPSGAEPAEEHVLARLGADLDPALGNHAPDRLLGPWTTLLRLPRDQRLLQVAMAAGALMLTEEQPFTPRRMWTRRKPVPAEELRDRIRTIAHAPYTVYPVRSLDGDLATLGPGVGAPAPEAPVRVADVPSLPGEPPLRAGDTLACRVADAPDGPVACLAFAIPGPVPDAAWAWLDLILLEHRLSDRRAGPRDVLRMRGHVLVRRVAEAAWL